jgi:hypothetical protein
VTRAPAPAAEKVPRTACARALVRGGTDEKTGEALTTAAVTERVAWCAALVKDMAARLVTAHWNPAGLESLASGRDAAGRALPAMAWMALRRLGWGAAPPDGVTRRGLPQERPRHTAQMGTRPPARSREHGITGGSLSRSETLPETGDRWT